MSYTIINDNPFEPAAKCIIICQFSELLKGCQKRFLEDILGIHLIVQKPDCDIVHSLRILFIEHKLSFYLSSFTSFDDLPVDIYVVRAHILIVKAPPFEDSWN